MPNRQSDLVAKEAAPHIMGNVVPRVLLAACRSSTIAATAPGAGVFVGGRARGRSVSRLHRSRMPGKAHLTFQGHAWYSGYRWKATYHHLEASV